MVHPLIARINRHNYDLFPLIGIMATVCVGATGYAGYCLFKSDVTIAKNRNPHPWQKVDSSKPQKFVTINQKWESSPAIEKLRKEIGS